jgi:hypothetical protein
VTTAVAKSSWPLRTGRAFDLPKTWRVVVRPSIGQIDGSLAPCPTCTPVPLVRSGQRRTKRHLHWLRAELRTESGTPAGARGARSRLCGSLPGKLPAAAARALRGPIGPALLSAWRRYPRATRPARRQASPRSEMAADRQLTAPSQARLTAPSLLQQGKHRQHHEAEPNARRRQHGSTLTGRRHTGREVVNASAGQMSLDDVVRFPHAAHEQR